MRCPECLFFCADSKDLCPKCYLDLRPHKRALSLPISRPDASYDTLLGESGKRPASTSPKATKARAAKPSFFSKLLSALSKPKRVRKAVAAPVTPVISKKLPSPAAPKNDSSALSIASAPIKEKKVSKYSPSPAAAPKVIDLSNLDEELDKVIDEMIQSEPTTFEAMSAPQTKVKPAAAEVDIPEIQIDFEDLELNPRRGGADNLPEASQNRTSRERKPSEPLRSEVPPPSVEPPVEIEAQPDLRAVSPEVDELLSGLGETVEIETVEKKQEPVCDLSCFAANPAEPISAAFHDAAAELELRMPREIEFSYQELTARGKDDHLDVLFQLAEEAIENPGAEKNYSDEIETNTKRKVEVGLLEKQLKSVEKVLEAPAFSLKKGSAVAPMVPPSSESERVFLPSAARAKARLSCAVIDGILVVLTSAALSILLSVESPLTFLDNLLQPSQFEPLEVIFPAAFFLALVPVLTILYPLFCLLAAHRTLGALCTGLLLISADGRKPKKSQIFVRALSLPLSIVTLGALPALRGKPCRHDLLSGTFFKRQFDVPEESET